MVRRRATVVAAACLLCLAAPSGRAASVSVDQSGQQFGQTALTVAKGDTVVFTNRDDVTHNISVVNDDDDATDLGLQKPGEALSYRFDERGKFKVRCSIHPSMRMKINVE